MKKKKLKKGGRIAQLLEHETENPDLYIRII